MNGSASSEKPECPGLQLHHIALKIFNLTCVEPFYCEILGLPKIREWMDDRGHRRSIWLALGEVILMLEQLDQVKPQLELELPRCDSGWHLIAVGIRNTERELWKQKLEAAGVAIEHETAFSFYVRDPEQNRVAFSHYPEPVGVSPV